MTDEPKISADEAMQRLRNCGYVTEVNYFGTKLDVWSKDRKIHWQPEIVGGEGTHYGEPAGERRLVRERDITNIVQQSHRVNS